MYNKTIIEFGFRMISWIIKTSCLYYLKWWRHKNEISEIMGFVRIFWKNNVQEAYLPSMSISGQIEIEMLAGYTHKIPYKPF